MSDLKDTIENDEDEEATYYVPPNSGIRVISESE